MLHPKCPKPAKPSSQEPEAFRRSQEAHSNALGLPSCRQGLPTRYLACKAYMPCYISHKVANGIEFGYLYVGL